MTDLKSIREAANAAFEKENFELAFTTLWQAGLDNFVRSGEISDKQKFNRFTHPKSGKYFWTHFVLKENVFPVLFNSDHANQLLHYYFSQTSIIFKTLEEHIAFAFPEKYIRAVRTNLVFLKPDRYSVLNSLTFPDKYASHSKIWKMLFQIEDNLWKGIEAAADKISSLKLNDILCQVVIWLENERFQKNNKESIHHLASVYSLFVDLLSSKIDEGEFKNIYGEDQFLKHFFEKVRDGQGTSSLGHAIVVGQTLNAISQWINFRDSVIYPYSYDLAIEPIQLSEQLLFAVPPESRYKWRLDGARYEVTQLRYQHIAMNFVDGLIASGKLGIPGKTTVDIQNNLGLAVLKWSTILLLNDLGVTSLLIGGKDVDIEKLLSPIITYSFNRMLRYEIPLAKYSATSNSWTEAFLNQSRESIDIGIRCEPFLLTTTLDFQVLNQRAIPNLSVESAEQITKLISHNLKGNSKFDRFQHGYDVFKKPFLNLNGILFCPTIFFGSNVWFYSFAQGALTYFKTKEKERGETRLMENQLAERFRKMEWNVKIPTDQEVNQIQGDVDIIIDDEETVLLIQLKRTYFRVNLKDAYFESINSDRKASRQLNDAEKFLSQPNSIYTLNKKPVKWILSTSFESIGERFEGCIKASFFEILNALNNPQLKTVADLVNSIEKEKDLKDFSFAIFSSECPDEIKDAIQQTGLPLRIFETKEYRQEVFTEDGDKTRARNTLFNQALEKDNDGYKQQALSMLKKCLELTPEDPEIWGAIANIYADLREFGEANTNFLEALRLAPNDPYILRNYSLSLLESGSYYESLKVGLQAYERFPLMGDLWFLFKMHFQECIRRGLLTNEQTIELKTKWDKLN